MNSLLIVEDDPDIIELLSINLQDMPYSIDQCSNGVDALEKIKQEEYSLVILDLMLPGLDGLEVCRQVRMHQISVPILILTAKSEEIDKVLGLEIGADDYVVKPFGIRELKARIKALLRRAQNQENTNDHKEEAIYHFDHMTINVPMRKVLIGEEKIDLSRKEFDLLVLLASHPGISFSRSRLLNEVWGYDFSGFEHTVNTHINRLRSKIEEDMTKPKYILTTWGIGYRFNEELITTHGS